MIVSGKEFSQDDLIQHDDLWHTWYHHSSFSHQDPVQCLSVINDQLKEAKIFLKKCNFLIITYGTALVFAHIKSDLIVSNCHKIPSAQFKRIRLSTTEIEKYIHNTIELAQKLNPSIQIIFSVSPIRHLKNGMIENQISKSSLILALHNTINNTKSCSYFPAFEIMMDDLRDYRFYEQNLTHPSKTAIEYIWNKFAATWLSAQCQSTIKEIECINLARSHKILFPGSGKEQVFLRNQLKNLSELKQKYPYIDFSEDVEYFTVRINDKSK